MHSWITLPEAEFMVLNTNRLGLGGKLEKCISFGFVPFTDRFLVRVPSDELIAIYKRRKLSFILMNF